MSKLKKKYNRSKKDLLKSLKGLGRQSVVLSIEVLETSKINDHLIYECVYLDNAIEKQINIIARDITEAMQKLEPYVGAGIPDTTTNLILGSERYADVPLDPPV
jgi:hypothetical protein